MVDPVPQRCDAIRADVQIANPVTFLAQKVLIHARRDQGDRAKDILYMHDTLQVFGAQLAELAALEELDSVPSCPEC